MARFPARLHILLAHSAPIGLIFRRGPSKSVCTILWDRQHDRFDIGQWQRGRIYERRTDLSPDGKYLIYFALDGQFSSETKGSWTAISRAPYLKAVVLLGKGDGWHGGGLFTGKRSYWLNDGYGHTLLRNSSEVIRDESYKPPTYYGGECPGVYYVRLQRDGWQLRKELSDRDCEVFEKKLPNGFLLRKFAHAQVNAPQGKSCYWDEHELEHPDEAQRISGANWEWADLDSRRLVFAEKGCLYQAKLTAKEPFRATLLADFNPLQFSAIAAPY